MTLPYTSRICTLIGSDEFELARFHRRINPSDIAFWTEDREDRTWVERPLTDKETDTPRPRVRDLSKSSSRKRRMRIKATDYLPATQEIL